MLLDSPVVIDDSEVLAQRAEDAARAPDQCVPHGPTPGVRRAEFCKRTLHTGEN
jgi:hypothetical protein